MNQTLVIAEAGVNHNGDIDLALQLVDAAAKAGADIVKFQTFRPEMLATAQAGKARYQKTNIDDQESQLTMLDKLQLTTDNYSTLVDYCKYREIEFLSTAFDLPSIDLVNTFDLKRLKVPSGEITNLPYLRKIASLRKPVILSTGMSCLSDIEAAINVLCNSGIIRENITVLHCTTEYPAPIDEVNLRAIQTIANAFGVPVGYSDHTDGIAIPIAAVAMGAVVIEKHLTLDRTMDGPDHRSSLEPDQFGLMVKGIRSVQLAMGDGIKRATKSEVSNIPIVRKSIVASSTIKIGDLYTTDNITSKRPGTGISPMFWDQLIGKPASRSYDADDLIEW